MNIVTQPEILLLGVEVSTTAKQLPSNIANARQLLSSNLATIVPDNEPIWVDAFLEYQGDISRYLISCQITAQVPIPDALRAVRIPPASYLHHTHESAMDKMKKTLDAMHDWAAEEHIPLAEFTLDFSEHKDEAEPGHELFIALQPAPQWQWI